MTDKMLDFLGYAAGGHLDVYLKNAEDAFRLGCADIADAIRDLADAVRERNTKDEAAA